MFSFCARDALAFARGGLGLAHCTFHACVRIRFVLELPRAAFKTNHEALFILISAGIAVLARTTSDFFLVLPQRTQVAYRLGLVRVEFPRDARETIRLGCFFLVVPDRAGIAGFLAGDGLKKSSGTVIACELSGGDVGRLACGAESTRLAPLDGELTGLA